MRRPLGPGLTVEAFLVYALLATAGIYISLINVGGLSIRFFELTGICWLVLVLPRVLVPRDWIFSLFYILVLSILLSIAVHGFEKDGILLFLRVTVGIFLATVPFIGLSKTQGGVRRGVVVWSIGGLVVVGLGIVFWLLATGGVAVVPSMIYRSVSGFRAESTLPDPNRFGSFSAVLASVSGLMVMFAKRKKGWVLALGVASLGVLISGSRGALGASIVGSVLALGLASIRVPHLASRELIKRVGLLGVTLFIGVAVVQTYAPERNIFGRFTGRVGLREEDHITTNTRIVYARYIWDDVSSSATSIIFGTSDYGRIEVDRVEGKTFSPHNLYLTILAAQGMVGLTVFLALFALLIIRGVRVLGCPSRENRDAAALHAALLGGLLTSLIHGLTVVLYTTGFFWVFTGLYAAVVSAPADALLPTAGSRTLRRVMGGAASLNRANR